MPYEDMKKTRSNTLAAYFRLEHPPLRGHDALDDALSVTYVLQHLLKAGQLSAEHFRPHANAAETTDRVTSPSLSK